MIKVVFVHGWGEDCSLWNDVQKYLSCDHFMPHFVDMGFFHKPIDLEDTPAIYITHSMGTPWVLKHKKNILGLMTINGFTYFTKTDQRHAGVDKRVLLRMLRQFKSSPHQVLRDFMLNAGLENYNAPNSMDEHLLLDGLEFLLECDVRDQYAQLAIPRLHLASSDDAIVSQELSESSFGRDIFWYKNAHHVLPLSHPQEIAGKLTHFLKAFQ